jgi:hypothetical protein
MPLLTLQELGQIDFRGKMLAAQQAVDMMSIQRPDPAFSCTTLARRNGAVGQLR